MLENQEHTKLVESLLIPCLDEGSNPSGSTAKLKFRNESKASKNESSLLFFVKE